MAKQLYLIKTGEISLKGQNRAFFEKTLKHNVKDKIKPYGSNCVKQKGRLYIYVDEECPSERIEKSLSTTFGIAGWARAVVTEKSIERIKEKAKGLVLKHDFDGVKTFRIECKREDKSFPLSSYELACTLAAVVNEIHPELKVNLKHPDFTLYAEIRDQAYLYTSSVKGMDGLPAGTAGRGLLLLSGGIDSPIAGIEMAKRGLKMDCLYFHAYPYTSEMALEKVKKLASLIAPYLNGTKLFVVPFTEGQLHIRDHAEEKETTLMFRGAMMRTATMLSEERGLEAIVTGEALSQVASQTLKAMSFTDSMTDMLILRPLVGMDKAEIIGKARKIGTYETSILPYEDCCVIFSPKHPLTHPDKEEMRKHYESLGMDEIIKKAVRESKIYVYDANGVETDEFDNSEAGKR